MDVNRLKRTRVTAVLRHNGRQYRVIDDGFGPGFRLDWAEAMWLTGAMSDSTNRSILIRQQCNPEFPILHPGEKSLVLIDVAAEEGVFDPIPESPLIREHLMILRRKLWSQPWSEADNREDAFEMDRDYGARRSRSSFKRRQKISGTDAGVLAYLATSFPLSRGVGNFSEPDMLKTKGGAYNVR